MQFRIRGFLTASFAVLGLLQACKKHDLTNNLNPPPASEFSNGAIKDSAASYSRDIYLWYNQIPGTFNAQTYPDLNAIMQGIRQYSTEPGFSTPVDKWSFAMKKTEWDNLSSGVSGDFGMNVFFLKEGDLRVTAVERGSPAGIAGIRRGWRIAKINGSADINTANANLFLMQFGVVTPEVSHL